ICHEASMQPCRRAVDGQLTIHEKRKMAQAMQSAFQFVRKPDIVSHEKMLDNQHVSPEDRHVGLKIRDLFPKPQTIGGIYVASTKGTGLLLGDISKLNGALFAVRAFVYPKNRRISSTQRPFAHRS